MDIYRVGENEIGKADIVLNRGENKHLGVPKIAVGRFRLNQPGPREGAQLSRLPIEAIT
jgi:hypothetical protein